MKRLALTVMLSLASLMSCQKVIDVDLNDSASEVVIEAIITDSPDDQPTVTITRSVNFDESNTFPPVTGATVTASDDNGNTYVFDETSPGVYTSDQFTGIAGTTYYLLVTADGKTYESTCRMPVVIPFDGVAFQSTVIPGETEPGNIVIPQFSDPTGTGNCYRFKISNHSTGKKSKSILLINDEIVDGGVNSTPIADQEVNIRSGDSISVEMMCIAPEVFDYFYSMSQNGNGPNASASPANPLTNINGGKLGHFSAHTTRKIHLIVP